jgi:hypothetical protein
MVSWKAACQSFRQKKLGYCAKATGLRVFVEALQISVALGLPAFMLAKRLAGVPSAQQ